MEIERILRSAVPAAVLVPGCPGVTDTVYLDLLVRLTDDEQVVVASGRLVVRRPSEFDFVRPDGLPAEPEDIPSAYEVFVQLSDRGPDELDGLRRQLAEPITEVEQRARELAAPIVGQLRAELAKQRQLAADAEARRQAEEARRAEERARGQRWLAECPEPAPDTIVGWDLGADCPETVADVLQRTAREAEWTGQPAPVARLVDGDQIVFLRPDGEVVGRLPVLTAEEAERRAPRI